MTAIPRRQLEELYAKYDLHSNLFDIYVEGDFDFDLMNNFLSETSITNVSVFHIDDIDVGAPIVEQSGFSLGSNKAECSRLRTSLMHVTGSALPT